MVYCSPRINFEYTILIKIMRVPEELNLIIEMIWIAILFIIGFMISIGGFIIGGYLIELKYVDLGYNNPGYDILFVILCEVLYLISLCIMLLLIKGTCGLCHIIKKSCKKNNA